ncbi:hypothetical protein ABK040_015833 [Willaertia magna]
MIPENHLEEDLALIVDSQEDCHSHFQELLDLINNEIDREDEKITFQKHVALTTDEYPLTLFQLKEKKEVSITKRPILLQHGLFNSSNTWIVTGKNYCLAYLLLKAGFDVWLGNNRGNQYSRRKEQKSDNWKFSFHEMGMFDVKCQMDYILNYYDNTEITKLAAYIAHSQGTTQGFVAFSTFPELQEKVEMFIALAPVTYLQNQSSQGLKVLTYFRPDLLLSLLNWGEVTLVSPNSSMKSFLSFLGKGAIGPLDSLMDLFMDCEIPDKVKKYLLKYEPSPTSYLALCHWSQLLISGKFQSYDHGKELNMIKYQQETPIEYDISNIKIPTVLFYGDLDFLGNAKDVETNVIPRMSNVILHSELIPNFKHNDFVWGKRAKELVYDKIIE